jgi:hypothetical protein
LAAEQVEHHRQVQPGWPAYQPRRKLFFSVKLSAFIIASFSLFPFTLRIQEIRFTSE